MDSLSNDPLKCYELYRRFKYDHINKITELILQAYAPVFEDTYKHVIHCTDFPTMVGVPLLIVGVVWRMTSSVNSWIILAIMIGVGFIIRWHQRIVVNCACKYQFQSKRQNIIAEYIDQQLQSILEDLPDEQHEETVQLYKYFYQEMLAEDFYYRKKKK